jgi:predicted nucleic acid-binding protein
MSPSPSIYLDTNIIIAFVEGPQTDDFGILGFIEQFRGSEKVTFRTSSLCFAELLVIPYRDGNTKLVQYYQQFLSGNGWIVPYPVDPLILDTAAVIRSKFARLKLPDAVHLATASVSRCSHFISFDKDFRDFEEMEHPTVNGFLLSSVKILRPNSAALSALAEELRP